MNFAYEPIRRFPRNGRMENSSGKNSTWEHIADVARTAMERMSTTKNEKRARKQTERKYYSAERERRHSSHNPVREK
jgi:hypothetical protein